MTNKTQLFERSKWCCAWNTGKTICS